MAVGSALGRRARADAAATAAAPSPRPQQRADKRPHRIRPARQRGTADVAHSSTRPAQNSSRTPPARPAATAESAAHGGENTRRRRPARRTRAHAGRTRRVATSISRPETPGDADADEARLLDAPVQAARARENPAGAPARRPTAAADCRATPTNSVNRMNHGLTGSRISSGRAGSEGRSCGGSTARACRGPCAARRFRAGSSGRGGSAAAWTEHQHVRAAVDASERLCR